VTINDEEQATQAFADYLRRQTWNPGVHPATDTETGLLYEEATLNAWWVTRAEDTLDAVAEIGAKLWGDTGLDEDEIEALQARIDAAVRDSLSARDELGVDRDLLVRSVLEAVKGFINGQVV
jgi:hypothetical protein